MPTQTNKKDKGECGTIPEAALLVKAQHTDESTVQSNLAGDERLYFQIHYFLGSGWKQEHFRHYKHCLFSTYIHTEPPHHLAILLMWICKEKLKSVCLKEQVHSHVHCRAVYNSHDDSTWVPVDRWMEKTKGCVYTMYIIQPEYNGVLWFEAPWMIVMLRETS